MDITTLNTETATHKPVDAVSTTNAVDTATSDLYETLTQAFDFFNQELFLDTLPRCIIVLERKNNTLGHFIGDKWEHAINYSNLCEIALNQDSFIKRSLAKTLSTLVHEMTHLQQHVHGKPSRNGYHNRQWVTMMSQVGLIASNTSEKGGKQTGQRMSHYIEENGRFEQAFKKLESTGFMIPWNSIPNAAKIKKTRESKTKYTCPACDLNAWGKINIKITCYDCQTIMAQNNL
jgi:hypothetical protein